jgi:hypothetical protein
VYPYFDVEGIWLERLLGEWKWLVDGEFHLLAVNAFGDLLLADAQDNVHWLDVMSGTISVIGSSSKEFMQSATDAVNKPEWLLEELALQAEQKGLCPGKGQCIGYKVPLIFKESADTQQNAYVADLYEYVSFMGDIHRQINDVPDGGKVRIKIERRPKSGTTKSPEN